MIDYKDSHIPLPLIMVTCTALRHPLVEWQINKGVHPKASKSKLNADRPDRSNYLNYKNDSGINTSCHAETGRRLVTLPGIADTYTFRMNSLNTPPESYQQRVYKALLLQSSVRANRQKTQCLPWSSAQKKRMLAMLFILTIWPPRWWLRSLRS